MSVGEALPDRNSLVIASKLPNEANSIISESFPTTVGSDKFQCIDADIRDLLNVRKNEVVQMTFFNCELGNANEIPTP